MTYSSELAGWLCLSQTGAALHARLPAASHEPTCQLCGDPHSAISDTLPCLHWLTNSYCKPARLASVFANYAVAEAVRYVLIWTQSESKRSAARHLRCSLDGEAAEIHIGFRNRSWRFLLESEQAAVFEYASIRTGFSFRIPLTLQPGEADALRLLTQLTQPA